MYSPKPKCIKRSTYRLDPASLDVAFESILILSVCTMDEGADVPAHMALYVLSETLLCEFAAFLSLSEVVRAQSLHA
jgi:hypothetical protein